MVEAPDFCVGDILRDSNGCDLIYKESQTITIIGDKTYMIGGTNDDPSSFFEVKVYDKFTGNRLSFTVLGAKPKMCKSHSAFPLKDDRILILRENSSLDDYIWFLEVGTKFVRDQRHVLGTEVIAWSKGVVGDAEKPIVISGPSGVGKGTLISMLMKEYPSMFGFSVSHTTRIPRENEINGVHYHFTEKNIMEEDIKYGKFLEFASVHGNLYGTSMEAVEVVADAGKRCILDIDVQGARSVRAASLEAIFIFICPPSIEELQNRLRERGTETKEQIEKRIRNASAEIKDAKSPGLFDYFLENNDLQQCYINLKKLLGLQQPTSAEAYKPSIEMFEVVRLLDHRRLLMCRGNEKLKEASNKIMEMDVSSLKGGAPGRTRILKCLRADSCSRNGIS